jgi:ribonuclease HI
MLSAQAAGALRSSSTTTACFFSSPPHTKSDIITRSDPGQIFPEKDYVLCFAGKSRGSTETAGLGMVLFDSIGNEVWWGHQTLVGFSSNECDYISLVTGLQCALAQGVQRITAQGCNGMLFQQMGGKLKVKKPSLQEYYDKVMSLNTDFETFNMRQVEKPLNKRAINLARTAIDTQDSLDPNNTTTNNEGGRNNDNPDWCDFSPSTITSLNTLDVIPEKIYVLRFDGGSRGNPGRAGAGMVLYDGEDGSEVWSGSQYLGDRDHTNNEAEYMGLITGLSCARSMGVENIVAQGDSQLILRQIEGRYKVKSPSLKDYYNKAISLSKEFASFQTNHIERARNARADELANIAMDTESSHGFNIS